VGFPENTSKIGTDVQEGAEALAGARLDLPAPRLIAAESGRGSRAEGGEADTTLSEPDDPPAGDDAYATGVTTLVTHTNDRAPTVIRRPTREPVVREDPDVDMKLPLGVAEWNLAANGLWSGTESLRIR
jgi:hypothetical protein